MLDALVIGATRSRTVDILLVAGYALAVPVFIRAVRSRRRRPPTAALAGPGARVLALPERTRTEPVDEPEVIDVEAELEPEPEPEPVVQPVVTLAPDPPRAPRLADAEPVEARGLRAFGTPPAGNDETDLIADDVDECQIAVWRGFRKSHFYAAPVLGDDVVAVGLYTSPLFRARGGEPQETNEAVAAYEELVAALERDDWVLVEQGEAWYAGRFRRAENGRGPD